MLSKLKKNFDHYQLRQHHQTECEWQLTLRRAHNTQKTRTPAVPAWSPQALQEAAWGEQRLCPAGQHPASPSTHSDGARDAGGGGDAFTAHEHLNLPPPPLGPQAPEAYYLLTGVPPSNSSAPIFCYFINCLPVLPPKDTVRCNCDPPGPYSPPQPAHPPLARQLLQTLGHFNHVSCSLSSPLILLEDEGQNCIRCSRQGT